MYYLKANITKPLCCLSAGIFKADGNWIHSTRVIDSFEIMIGIHGSIYMEQEGERFTLKEGEVLLLLPGRQHRGFACSEKGTSFFWMHFLCDSGYEILDARSAEESIIQKQNNPFMQSLDAHILLPACFKPSGIERIQILYRQLLHIREAGYYAKTAENYLLTSLLIELTQQAVQGNERSSHEDRDVKLTAILEWVRIHLTTDLSLQTVAHEFNYSREHLARFFKKQMGMTLREYIHKNRIDRAKGLLCQSDANIREIAHRLGFEDEKYFMKLFKRYENMSPGAYRRAYYKTHLNNQ